MKSRKRKDDIHLKLLELSSPALKNLRTHGNCISTYTSETHIKRYMKKKEKDCFVKISSRHSIASIAPIVICVYHFRSWSKHAYIQGSPIEGK